MSLRRGTARSLDHAQLVHEQWFQAAVLGIKLYVTRVGTKENIADLPSRMDFAFLRKMGACEYKPVLIEKYEKAETWNILQQ
eukprot:5791564-Karenia_brevis.AAC.1